MGSEVDIADLNDLEDLMPLDSLIGEIEYDSDFCSSQIKSEDVAEDVLSILSMSIEEKIVADEEHPLNLRLAEISDDIIVTSFHFNQGQKVVGSKKGSTFYFDESNNYISTFQVSDKNCGSVTALALSRDNKRLLIGYSRGGVYMYDTSSPKSPLRHLPSNCHAIESAPVNFLRFYSSNSTAICADSSSITKLWDSKLRVFQNSIILMKMNQKDILNPYSVRIHPYSSSSWN